MADELAAGGVPVWLDSRHAIAHNKVSIIDGSLVATGSWNASKSANTRNAENMLIVRDKPLADRFRNNFQLHLRHSHPMR